VSCVPLRLQQGMDGAPAFTELSPNLGGVLFNFGYTFVILWYGFRSTAVLFCQGGCWLLAAGCWLVAGCSLNVRVIVGEACLLRGR
jgi:hypothetical protein